MIFFCSKGREGIDLSGLYFLFIHPWALEALMEEVTMK